MWAEGPYLHTFANLGKTSLLYAHHVETYSVAAKVKILQIESLQLLLKPPCLSE